jgi:hypothetical protein
MVYAILNDRTSAKCWGIKRKREKRVLCANGFCEEEVKEKGQRVAKQKEPIARRRERERERQRK